MFSLAHPRTPRKERKRRTRRKQSVESPLAKAGFGFSSLGVLGGFAV
jgi:hypothetical protein